MRRPIRPQTVVKGVSPLVSDQLWLLAILAAASFVGAMAIIFTVSLFTDIRFSAWNIVGSIAPWYIAIMSGWILFVQFPLFVSHGHTRKAAYREWTITGAGLAGVGALLMPIGFLLEKWIYDIAGFTTEGESQQFFGGAGAIPEIVYQNLMTFAVWFVLGGFVGGCLYRSADWGWLSIPVAVGIASIAGFWNHTGGGFFGVARRFLPGIDYESHLLDLGLAAAAIALGAYALWMIAHDLPLRNP